jgi:hypothetical protein
MFVRRLSLGSGLLKVMLVEVGHHLQAVDTRLRVSGTLREYMLTVSKDNCVRIQRENRSCNYRLVGWRN